MIALLAALGLLVVGPLMVIVPCHRAARRWRRTGIAGDRAASRADIRPSETGTVFGGLVVLAASVLALSLLAVLG